MQQLADLFAKLYPQQIKFCLLTDLIIFYYHPARGADKSDNPQDDEDDAHDGVRFHKIFESRRLALQDTPPLDQPDKDDDDSHHQQNVDEASHGGTGNQSKQPQDDENNCNSH